MAKRQTPQAMRRPLPECDLIFEGGVTSAVIYAQLMRWLGLRMRLRSLGGASSGAIAAAAAAIAAASSEALANQAEPGSGKYWHTPFRRGFQSFLRELRQTDDQQRTGLERAFVPAPALAPLLQLLLTGLRGFSSGNAGRSDPQGVMRSPWWSVLGELLRQLPGWSVLGLALALLAVGRPPVDALPTLDWLWPEGLLANTWHGLVERCDGSLAGLMQATWQAATGLVRVAALSALLLAGTLGLPAFVLLYRALKALPGTHFGLCTGMGALGQDDAHALTPLLHRFFNGLMGLKPEDPPVTFGHLAAGGLTPEGQPRIELAMVTTVLNLREPLRLPGTAAAPALRGFFYDPVEWAALFPASVMDWLKQHAPPLAPALTVPAFGQPEAPSRPLLALPDPAALPIIVCARLSLSFPLLLSAVPMYSLRDGHGRVWNRPVQRMDFEPQRVYFSDGGISSNCPLDLFDRALPSRPTFTVNLYDPAPGSPGRVHWGGRRSDPETAPSATPAKGLSGLIGFLGSILMTSLQWRDTLSRRQPGNAERTCHIGVPPELGGLNLTMTPDEIGQLMKRGQVAARLLARYDQDESHSPGHHRWDEHRWIRLRKLLAGAQRLVLEVARAPAPGDPPAVDPAFTGLLHRQPTAEPALPGPRARADASRLLAGLTQLAQGQSPAGKGVTANEPTAHNTTSTPTRLGPRLPL